MNETMHVHERQIQELKERVDKLESQDKFESLANYIESLDGTDLMYFDRWKLILEKKR